MGDLVASTPCMHGLPGHILRGRMAARILRCTCAVCTTIRLICYGSLQNTCSPLAVLLRISSTVGWAAGRGLCAPGRILVGSSVLAGLKIARCTGVLTVSIAVKFLNFWIRGKTRFENAPGLSRGE